MVSQQPLEIDAGAILAAPVGNGTRLELRPVGLSHRLRERLFQLRFHRLTRFDLSTYRDKVDEVGKTYAAKVARIGARVDPVTQTVDVTAALNGNASELLPGMSGWATFAR